MTWIHDAGGNDGYNSTLEISKADGDRHGVLFLPIKALAVAAGWTVTGSGDGASAHEFNGTTGGAGAGSGGAYDVWTTQGAGSGGAGDASNNRAWVLLTDPGGTAQLLLVGVNNSGSGWDAYGNVLYAPKGGYAATGIGPTTPPAAAATEFILRGDRAFGSGAQLINFTGAAYLNILFDNALDGGVYRFLVGVWDRNLSAVHDTWGVMTFEEGSDTGIATWETDPTFILGGGSNAATGASPASLRETQSLGQSAERTYTTTNFLSNSIWDSKWAPENSPDDPVDGSAYAVTIGYLRQEAVANEEYGPLFMKDIYTTVTSPTATYPDYTDNERTGLRFVHWGNLLLPFGLTASAQVPAGGSSVKTKILEFLPHLVGVGGSADETAPTLSNLSPADGAALARTDTVTFDVTDAVGLRDVLVMVEFPATGEYEVIHDGDNFAATYSSSTRTAITNGYRFVLTRENGWIGSPTFRVQAIDTSGNEVA